MSTITTGGSLPFQPAPIAPSICPSCHKCNMCGRPDSVQPYVSPYWYYPNYGPYGPFSQSYQSNAVMGVSYQGNIT